MTPVHQLTPEQAVQELEQLEDQGPPDTPKERQAYDARKNELSAWILMHPQTQQTEEPPMPAPTAPEQKLATIKARFDKTGDSKEAWAARKLCEEHGLAIPPWAEKRGPARGPRTKREPLVSQPVRVVIADEVDEPPSLAEMDLAKVTPPKAPDLAPYLTPGAGFEQKFNADPVLDTIRDARASVWELLAKMERIHVKDRAAYTKELELLQSATTTAFLMAQGEVA